MLIKLSCGQIQNKNLREIDYASKVPAAMCHSGGREMGGGTNWFICK